ncbi:MAG TPA: TonB-dependent receptor, partial [Allosphingosinicella sp.]
NGPGALAGTIELTSAAPEEIAGIAAGFAYGRRDGVDTDASFGLRTGEGFVTVSGAWMSGAGFIPVVAEQRGPADRPSPYRQGSLSLRGIVPVAQATELQANVAAFTDRRERGTVFSDIATRGGDASLRLVRRGALPFSALVYIQLRDFSNQFAAANADRSDANPTLDQYSVPSTGLGARFELRPLTGATELRLGADWRGVEGRTKELFSFSGGQPTRGRVAGGRSDTLGAYAELGGRRGPWTYSAGARLDHWGVTGGALRETLLATRLPLTDLRFRDRSGWEATGRAGIARRAADGLTLRAAAYRGWRLPTLNELYRPFRVGADATAANAALGPERLDGAEAGLDIRPAGNARIGLTFFANRLDDAISNVTLGEGPGLFPGVGFVPAGGQFRQRQNVDAILSRGFELDMSLAWRRWRLTGGYSYAWAEVQASGPAAALDGLSPAQAQRHSGSATLSWHGPDDAYAALSAHYAGAQYEDDLNRQRLPDALTFAAVAVLPVTDRLALEARAENLSGARVVAGISGAGIVERATPRTLWIGLRWRG